MLYSALVFLSSQIAIIQCWCMGANLAWKAVQIPFSPLLTGAGYNPRDKIEITETRRWILAQFGYKKYILDVPVFACNIAILCHRKPKILGLCYCYTVRCAYVNMLYITCLVAIYFWGKGVINGHLIKCLECYITILNLERDLTDGYYRKQFLW